MNDIKLKVDELIAVINSYVRKAEIANSELSTVDLRKSAILKQIEDSEKRMIDLKNINSDLNIKLKEDRNEAERLLNINKGKSSDLDKKLAEIDAVRSKLEEEKKVFDSKYASYVSKNSELSKRENDTNVKLKEIDAALEVLNKKESEIKTLISKSIDLEESHKAKLESVREQMKKASDLMVEANNIKAINERLSSELDLKSRELEKKKSLLNNEKLDVEKSKDELVYRELELAKIVKDKELGKDVADRFKFDVEKTAFNKDLEKFVADKRNFELEKSDFINKKSELDKKLFDLESNKNTLDLKKKQLDEAVIAFELEKSAHNKNIEGLKKSEKELEVKKLRAMKAETDKKKLGNIK